MSTVVDLAPSAADAKAFVHHSTRPTFTLDIIRADGTREGFSYSFLKRRRYHPGDGITLHFLEETVRIQGRCLEPLYLCLRDNHVLEIHEQHAPDLLVPEGETYVEGVSISEKPVAAF